MNLIQKQADEFLEYNLNTGDFYKNFISKVRHQLWEYKKIPYKIEFTNYLIRCIKLEYDNHLLTCDNLEECQQNMFYENVLFFLQEELEELENQLTPFEFASSEKNEINLALEKILYDLNLLKIGQEISYDDLSNEFEDLKDMYFLNKKHWSQIFAGKLTEMVAGGIISDTLSKEIIEIIKNNYSNVIGS